MNASLGILVLIIVGICFLVQGLYSAHKVCKKSGWYNRINAVLISATGVGLLWSVLAFNTPAYTDLNLRVVEASPKWMALQLDYNEIRRCSVDSFKVILTNDKGQLKISDKNSNLAITGVGKGHGLIHVYNPTEFDPDKVHVELMHRCPLGFHPISKFPKIDVPNEFADHGFTKP